MSSRKPKKNYRATFSSHPDGESVDDKDFQIQKTQGKIERLQEEIRKQKSGRIEAEKALEEHRRIMQQILDATPLPVFYKDSDARYAGCNKAYERAVDLPRKSIVGKTVFDLEPADLARKFSDLDAEVLRRPGIHTRRASFLYPNGSRQDATYIKTALHDAEGKVCGLVGIILPDDLPQNYREIEQLTGTALAQLPSAHVLFLQEKERAWLSRDLHDTVGQALTTIKINVRWLSGKLSEAGNSEIRQKIDGLSDDLDGLIETVRRISAGIRPLMLDDLGLSAACQWLLSDFEERTSMRCSLTIHPPEFDVEEPLATMLFRIMQEALTNIARHAGATQIWVEIAQRKKRIILQVRDNGCGIDQQEVQNPKSLGLKGMMERASIAGGTIEINGAPGRGTTIRVVVPLQ